MPHGCCAAGVSRCGSSALVDRSRSWLKWVFEQLLVVRRLLPFELLGVHSDNGGEFINAHLQRYCEQQQIDFTRSRADRKNDNNFTEQKNFDVVRKHVG